MLMTMPIVDAEARQQLTKTVGAVEKIVMENCRIPPP